MVRCEVERRAEALDLERPRELSADAVRDAAGRNDEERQEDERDDRDEQTETDESPRAGPAAARRRPQRRGTSTAG